MCDLKSYRKKCFFSRFISVVVLLSFLFFTIIPPGYAQNIQLPAVGTLVPLSPVFQPAVLRGIQVDPFKHLELKFIVDAGESGLAGEDLQGETNNLIHYFLASLAIPEKDLWVNLSPYEDDRIVPDALGKTEMGRDLLAQDYLLKQVTASLLYPDDELGKQFWQRVYKKAYEKYGTTNIPVNTFNKVWILPDTVKIYEEGDRAIITEAKMKVMLEEDYLSKEKNLKVDAKGNADETAQLSSEIIREIVIPEIEREINEGKNFAKVRQVYYSLVLAHWFKTKLKNVLMNKIFADLSKTKGFETDDPEVIDKIYDQYVESFKKGVCNVLRIDFDKNENKHIPRKYFSGGASMQIDDNKIEPATSASAITALRKAATLATAVVFFAFASLTGKAATPEDFNDDHNITTITATEGSVNNVYEVAPVDFEGPPSGLESDEDGFLNIPTPNVKINTDTVQQVFQKEVPFSVGDVIKSARGNAELTIAQKVPVKINNKGNKIDMEVVWGQVQENGKRYDVFFVQLSNPNPLFHKGHMTYSHSLQALINAAGPNNPSFRETLKRVSGKTIKDFEADLIDILTGDQAKATQDHNYMNKKGVNNPYQMSIGALAFVARSGERPIEVKLPPISRLDPLPFTGWEVGYDLVMEKIEKIEEVQVISKSTYNVKADGRWRVVSTAQGQDGHDLNSLVTLTNNFAQDNIQGNLGNWIASGRNFLQQFQGINTAGDQASEVGENAVVDAKTLIEELSQKDSTIFNILNLIVPDFLQKVNKNANDLSGKIVDGVGDVQGDVQGSYDQAKADASTDEELLAYIGFASQFLNNPYIQKKADSFINQLAENSYVQSGGGVLEAGTRAEIKDVATQIGGMQMEYSAVDKDGKIQNFSFNFNQVVSLRYLLSLDLNVLAQGKAGFDERTENLLFEFAEQATGDTFQGITNTLFEDLGNYNDPAFQELFDQILNGPSKGQALGQADLRAAFGGLVGGFRSTCAQLGWTSGNIKGIPVALNFFGGVAGYGVGQATMDIKLHTEAEVNALLEQGEFSGDLKIKMQGGVDAYARSTHGVKGFGGMELFFPNDGISFIVGYEGGQEVSTLNYVTGNGGAKFNMDQDGMINFDVSGNGTYAVGNDLITVDDFSYASQLDLGGMLDNLPDDMIKMLNDYAQQEAAVDFLPYLIEKFNVPSAWNNYVMGSEDIKDGLYNMLNGVNSEFGIPAVVKVIEEALEASGAQGSLDEFIAELQAEGKKKLEDIKNDWENNVKKKEREMAETTRFGNMLAQGMFIRNFGQGKVKGFVSQRLNQHDFYTIVGGTAEAGDFNFSASVQSNGLIDLLANQAAGESFLALGPVLAGYNISGSVWKKMVLDINYIINTTIKDGTFYDNIERIRIAVDNAFSNVDPKIRVCAIAALINNPQWRDTYRIDLNELQAKAFGLVRAQARSKDGKWTGSLSVENYWEGDQGFAPYFGMQISREFGSEEKAILLGAVVFFDPMFGATGGSLNVSLRGADIMVSYKEKITQIGAKINLDSFIKALDGKGRKIKTSPGSKVEVFYNNDGAALYNNQGGSLELIDYVPFESTEQAQKVLGEIGSNKGNGKIKGSRAQRKAKREKIKQQKEMNKKKAVDNILELMIDQNIEDIEAEEAENVKGSKRVGKSEGKSESSSSLTKGGIAFDSNKIDMQIEGTGLEFDFPDSLITSEMRNLMGLVPQIINFTPVTNPISLIGPLVKMEE
ncbi:MAG: hypothetical protein PHY73_07610 [Candidatus Omnitrophica bacterium]|nr:hypothetical protein [Candidatus Omnitrophota bacterium]